MAGPDASEREAVRIAADRLHDAQRSRRPCAPIRDLLPDADIAAAYAVQRHNVERALAAGRRVVGRKIGLTSQAVQRQLGVDQPDFGMLFADMEVVDGEEVSLARVLQPKVEVEAALVLERDLSLEQPTLVDLIGAVAYALPAIEIVGSRIANWDIRLVDTIADNASSALYVLGGRPKLLRDVDLRLCEMRLEQRGEVVSSGNGAACLGHPLRAALWLARQMIDLAVPLKAGDVVLTGALGPMTTVCAGDVFQACIESLGSVQAVFAQE